MGLNAKQLTEEVIRPTLEFLGLYSRVAAQLVLGTACQESNLKYLRQMNYGPAMGIYQMEPATHDDIWDNYLKYKPALAEKVTALSIPALAGTSNLQGNLFYSTAMCRVHYLRIREALPQEGDIVGLAKYWKKYYNTHLGKGRIDEFLENYKKYGGV